MAVPYKEFRCRGCHKLLFRGWIAEGEVEVKCKTCHDLTTIAKSQFDEMLCAVVPCPYRVSPEKAKKKKVASKKA